MTTITLSHQRKTIRGGVFYSVEEKATISELSDAYYNISQKALNLT
jgi:hypothetical protein